MYDPTHDKCAASAAPAVTLANMKAAKKALIGVQLDGCAADRTEELALYLAGFTVKEGPG
jgi:hypothetical protein